MDKECFTSLTSPASRIYPGFWQGFSLVWVVLLILSIFLYSKIKIIITFIFQLFWIFYRKSCIILFFTLAVFFRVTINNFTLMKTSLGIIKEFYLFFSTVLTCAVSACSSISSNSWYSSSSGSAPESRAALAIKYGGSSPIAVPTPYVKNQNTHMMFFSQHSDNKQFKSIFSFITKSMLRCMD